MTGYKVLNKDMSSIYGNMTYEPGQWYEVDGPIIPCKNGFHFCEKLEDTLTYCNPSKLKNYRFFKVETDGFVSVIQPDKYIAGKIRITEEILLPKETIEKNNKKKKNDILLFGLLSMFFLSPIVLLSFCRGFADIGLIFAIVVWELLDICLDILNKQRSLRNGKKGD